MSKNDVFDQLFYELYKIKDSYGVDKQVDFFNIITKKIKKKYKNTKVNITTTDWKGTTNLAIYKKGLGINPISPFDKLNYSDKKIPLNDFDNDFYEYYFIMTNTGTHSGDMQKDTFQLTSNNNEYILEDFNNKTEDALQTKIENLDKKIKEKTQELTEVTNEKEKQQKYIEEKKNLETAKKNVIEAENDVTNAESALEIVIKDLTLIDKVNEKFEDKSKEKKKLENELTHKKNIFKKIDQKVKEHEKKVDELYNKNKPTKTIEITKLKKKREELIKKLEAEKKKKKEKKKEKKG